MKKVLIAGGNGVIGRLLAEGLISDYEVFKLSDVHNIVFDFNSE